MTLDPPSLPRKLMYTPLSSVEGVSSSFSRFSPRGREYSYSLAAPFFISLFASNPSRVTL